MIEASRFIVISDRGDIPAKESETREEERRRKKGERRRKKKEQSEGRGRRGVSDGMIMSRPLIPPTTQD